MADRQAGAPLEDVRVADVEVLSLRKRSYTARSPDAIAATGSHPRTRECWTSRSSKPPPFRNPRTPKSYRVSCLRQPMAPRSADLSSTVVQLQGRRLCCRGTNDRIQTGNLEAPPGFEPGMEVLQIQRGRESCCLVLVSGLSSSPVLLRIRALLDYVRTTAAGDCCTPRSCCETCSMISFSWKGDRRSDAKGGRKWSPNRASS
jgi:hypothetical protein